jgi:hypothetical protein
MPVQFPQPPPQASAAVTDKLQRLGQLPTTNSRALGGAAPDGLTPTSPHETYVLGADAMLADNALDAATMTGWRYLLRDDGQLVASAETMVNGAGQHHFAAFNSGPYVAGTAEALQNAADLPQTRDQDMQARLLNIPALHLTALWLHGESGDVLVPLAPTPPGVEADRDYPAAELLGLLRDQARDASYIGPGDTRGS